MRPLWLLSNLCLIRHVYLPFSAGSTSDVGASTAAPSLRSSKKALYESPSFNNTVHTLNNHVKMRPRPRVGNRIGSPSVPSSALPSPPPSPAVPVDPSSADGSEVLHANPDPTNFHTRRTPPLQISKTLNRLKRDRKKRRSAHAQLPHTIPPSSPNDSSDSVAVAPFRGRDGQQVNRTPPSSLSRTFRRTETARKVDGVEGSPSHSHGLSNTLWSLPSSRTVLGLMEMSEAPGQTQAILQGDYVNALGFRSTPALLPGMPIVRRRPMSAEGDETDGSRLGSVEGDTSSSAVDSPTTHMLKSHTSAAPPAQLRKTSVGRFRPGKS